MSAVEGIERTVRYFVTSDASAGGGLAREAAVGQLKYAVDLAQYSSYSEAVGTRLLTVIANLASRVGWMSHDAGMAGPAQRYAWYGLRAAHEAGTEQAQLLAVRTLDRLSDDRTARAVIRDEGLRLFAARGADAVTIRQIAASAGVSPGLVVHHFGGKDGLRRAVDEHVVAVIDGLFAALPEPGWAAATGASLTEAFLSRLPADSPVPAYLRRLLLSGDPAGTRLFGHWFQACQRALDGLAAAGILTETTDPVMRTGFVTATDLAVLLLREPLTAVLGVDPLSRDGMVRWTDVGMAAFRGGLFRDPPSPAGARS
jgi:AcrR family transcriptional regulator